LKQKGLGRVLRPLLEALGQSEPEAVTPLAAYTALSQLRELPPSTANSAGSKRRKP
jgi:hypothetical protein